MVEIPEGYRIPSDDDDLLHECKVTTFRASGPGGQHKNKSDTAVRLQHEPTGMVVIGKRERSQRRNLNDALTRLREKLNKLLEKPKPRKATKPSKASKEKRITEKKQRSGTKQLRSRVEKED